MRACLPTTPLGMGALFFLLDPDAELAVTMANREMSATEWEQYSRSPMARRKRRPMTRAQALESELRQDDRQYAGAR